MRLYVVEAPVENTDGEGRTWSRTFVGSAAAASSERKRLTDLDVRRKDIRTTPVDVGTRKEELMPFLNDLASDDDDYKFGSAANNG